jgi:hypothetical protein
MLNVVRILAMFAFIEAMFWVSEYKLSRNATAGAEAPPQHEETCCLETGGQNGHSSNGHSSLSSIHY